MGGGSWSSRSYSDTTSARKARGEDAFAHSVRAEATGVYEVHDYVNPKRTNKAGDHTGLVTREALDSDEHPESLPIAVLFDVTGSMRGVPRVLQEKLPKLYGLLLEKGYVEHPQILYGAIGDATVDRVPLQVGQFESDNKADTQLGSLILEGGGGGGNHESYEVAAYFIARHTYTDSFEKRGKKGYLFLIGDEKTYSHVQPSYVNTLIGDAGLQEALPTKELFEELQEKWDVYYLFAPSGSYSPATVIEPEDDGTAVGWRELLGQNAIVLEDANAVCETIATRIGLAEGVLDDLDTGLAHLTEIGTDSATVKAVGKALATVGASSASGAVATLEGDFPDSDGDSAERL